MITLPSASAASDDGVPLYCFTHRKSPAMLSDATNALPFVPVVTSRIALPGPGSKSHVL